MRTRRCNRWRADPKYPVMLECCYRLFSASGVVSRHLIGLRFDMMQMAQDGLSGPEEPKMLPYGRTFVHSLSLRLPDRLYGKP